MKIKQNISYIGSKYSLLDFIEKTISNYIDYNGKSFCDMFAGTNIVGRYFKNYCNIITNDFEYYSYVLSKTYISNETTVDNSKLEYLNNLELEEGLFTKHYCRSRLYFSVENGMKIDTIRKEIENLHINKKINKTEYYYYLTSLIEAADKVANTTSIYAAYLKKLKKTANKSLVLKEINTDISYNNISYNKDANELINEISGDILYIDPPYNGRQYGSNYHILNTILKYDINDFKPKRKTGIREYNKSKFCSSVFVLETFEDLIKNAKFKYIFISYNNEGLMSIDEIKIILEKYGKYNIHEKNYKTYKSDSNRKNKSTNVIEYIIVLIKDSFWI